MTSIEICTCGIPLDIVNEKDTLVHARHIVKNIMEKMKMQNEKANWKIGVAYNKIAGFFQRKSQCPMSDCKTGYLEAHTLIESVQHLKRYLETIELGVGKENEKN